MHGNAVASTTYVFFRLASWDALRRMILIPVFFFDLKSAQNHHPNAVLQRTHATRSSQVRGSAEDPDVGVSWIPEDWGAGGDGSEAKHLSVANPRIPHPQFQGELDIAGIGGLFLGLLHNYSYLIEDEHLQSQAVSA